VDLVVGFGSPRFSGTTGFVEGFECGDGGVGLLVKAAATFAVANTGACGGCSFLAAAGGWRWVGTEDTEFDGNDSGEEWSLLADSGLFRITDVPFDLRKISELDSAISTTLSTHSGWPSIRIGT